MKAFYLLLGLLSFSAFAQNFSVPSGCCVPSNPNFASFCAQWNNPAPGADRYNRCVQAHDAGVPMCSWSSDPKACEGGEQGGDQAGGDIGGATGDICCAPKDPSNAQAVSLCNTINSVSNPAHKMEKCKGASHACTLATISSPLCRKPTDATTAGQQGGATGGKDEEGGCCTPKNPRDSTSMNVCGAINDIANPAHKKEKCLGSSYACNWNPAGSPLCKQDTNCSPGQVSYFNPQGAIACCDKASVVAIQDEKQCAQQGGAFGILLQGDRRFCCVKAKR